MSITLLMDFQFNLRGTALEHREASALLQASTPKTKQPFSIDLEKLIDVKILDANKLFSMSVEQQNPVLASLAVKLAMENKKTPTTKLAFTSKKKTTKLVATPVKTPPKKVTKTTDDIIDYLLTHSSYRCCGAAMLLLKGDTQEWQALRDIAISVVNEAADDLKLPLSSPLFKGFTLDAVTDTLVPIESNQATRRCDTYYVSPLYLSLRSGLMFCLEHDLVRISENWTTGSRNEEYNEKSGHLKRRYYVYKLTEFGDKLCSIWSDMDKYFYNYYTPKSGTNR